MVGTHELAQRFATVLATLLLVPLLTARCGQSAGPGASVRPPVTLRVGIGGAPSLSADRGVQQFVSNISNEGLLRVNQEGHLEPWLAESWNSSKDGLALTVRLRQGMKFHDGSPIDAAIVAKILNESLPKALRSLYDDVESITASGELNIIFKFRQPSSFIADSFIDVPIQKDSPSIGTGPFVRDADAHAGTTEMVGFGDYYLGSPNIDRIAISTYPNERAAWADLLRDRLDMLYEVGADALSTMQGSKSVSVYAFDRPFQYVVVLNPRSPKLKSPKMRQALNQAIDRDALVRDGLAGRGTRSAGPVSEHHWAFTDVGSTTFRYAPALAAASVGSRIALTCLTPAEPPYEQLALVVKQQLQAVGIDLTIDEVKPDNLVAAMSKPDFEAMLIDVPSGWSLVRPYRWWHSKGTQNVVGFSSAPIDAALDQVRRATHEADYKAAVEAFQRAVANDPPAVFLAWGGRSRAVSRRFDVEAQTGRDVLATLRLWRPTADKGSASHN
jgi:peptide/nickel transport system substrate-binding protein